MEVLLIVFIVLLIGLCITSLYVQVLCVNPKKKYMLIINNEVKYFKFYQQAVDFIKVSLSDELSVYKLFVKDDGLYKYVPIDVEAI